MVELIIFVAIFAAVLLWGAERASFVSCKSCRSEMKRRATICPACQHERKPANV